jgi:hypothetical protein
MLNKVILGGIITAVVIITAIGLFVGLGESGKTDVNDQSTNQEPYIPKKITIELSDGINMGEAGP